MAVTVDEARALLSDACHLLGMAMPERPWNMLDAAFLDVESTHTQAWIAWDPTAQEVQFVSLYPGYQS
jgi:hypothetical protein